MRLIDADKLVVHLKDEIEGCKPLYGGRTYGKSIAYGTVLGLKSAIAFIEALATIEPYGTWIPCSERLPEEGVNPITRDCYEYLVTADFEYVKDIRYYKFNNGHWWHGPGIVDERVIAWMPLPEPYRGEKM